MKAKEHENKPGFLIYKDCEEQVGMMSDEDAGKLFKALFAYENRGEVIDLPPVPALAFSFFKKELDRNRERYEEKRKTNKENGSKGGRPKNQQEEKEPDGFLEKPKKPNGFFENPPEPKETLTDTDTVTDTVTDTRSLRAREDFAKFWKMYPKKAAESDARAAWEELSPDDSTQRQIMDALRRAKASPQWREENGRYIPKAAKWLRERQWSNVVPLPVASYDIEELERLSYFDLPEALEE